MRNPLLSPVALVAALCTVSVDALACGESLFRVGQGARYRAYATPLPGSVLVVGSDDAQREVASGLEKAGHRVRLVQDQAEMSRELDSNRYDVIVAPYSERARVEAAATSASSRPQLVPVAAAHTAEEQQARESYPESVSSGDDIRRFLKSIHRTLTERASSQTLIGK
jgi:CheY-like chemotaxis protein